MSSVIRMLTTISAGIMVIVSMFFLFFNTSYDNERASYVQQVATVNLNRKANRQLPQSDAGTNQILLSHFSIAKLGKTKDGWSTSLPPYAYEEAVWEQLRAKFGDKISASTSQTGSFSNSYGNGLTAGSRKITWYVDGKAKGTIIFSYLYQGTLNNIYGVKVQAIISGRSYTANLGIIHDSNNNNFGNYSGVPLLDTPTSVVSSDSHKSGASIAKSYTTDAGYNVVWDSDFVQSLQYTMDRIRLTYQFDKNHQAVIIPSSLKKIYPNLAQDALPVKIMQTVDGNEPFQLTADQVTIDNNAPDGPKLTVTLTHDQSLNFLNLNYNGEHQLLFRVYTMMANGKMTNDYASGYAKLETLDANGTVLQTQTADPALIRLTPFAVQSLDSHSTLSTIMQPLTHFANRLYGTDQDKQTNNTIAQSQYQFGKENNGLTNKGVNG